MKRPHRALLLWLCLASAIAGAAADPLVFCFEDENVRPWQTKRGEGLSFDLLALVAADTGLRFAYRGAPWKRCLHDLKDNRYAGAISVSFKPERLEFGSYPGGNPPDTGKAIYVERYVVVRRREDATPLAGSLRGFQGIAGGQLGYSVVDDLRQAGIRVDDGARSSEDLLQKLRAKRIDVAVMLQGEIQSLLADNAGLRQALSILPEPFAEKPYYLLLSHQFVGSQPELAARIWQSIPRQRANPTYLEKERRALGASR